MENCLKSISSPQPVVVGLGESLSDLVEFLVVVEDKILTMPNLMTAVHSCLAC